MCGIVCAFNLKQSVDSIRPKILQMSKKIRHRGPDWSGIYSNKSAIIDSYKHYINLPNEKNLKKILFLWNY